MPNLTPNSKAVKAYYASLKRYAKAGAAPEGTTPAFYIKSMVGISPNLSERRFAC